MPTKDVIHINKGHTEFKPSGYLAGLWGYPSSEKNFHHRNHPNTTYVI